MTKADDLAAVIRLVDGKHELGAAALAEAIVDTGWFFGVQAEAFDVGVGIAGRYGHEDYWDEDNNPYNENPWSER